MRWMFMGVGLVLGALALLAGIGYSMPNVHVVQARADHRADAESLYAVLADLDGWSEWHPAVARIARVGTGPSSRSTAPTWRLSGPAGTSTVELVEREPPVRLRTLVDGGMFVSRWTYRIEPREGGTRVTITEEARIDNILIRGLAVLRRPIRGIERLLRALGERVGERVEPEPLT